MIDPASAILGPLVGPECKRAVGRGWLILIRTVAGSVALFVASSAFWYSWISVQLEGPGFQPFSTMIRGLEFVEGIILAVALVMGPALMAGSLAGEKERGSLGLLLTTRVSAFEIVAGRLSAKFSQVAMMILATLPAIIFPAAVARFHLSTIVVLLILPVAVAFGGAGLASAASAIARRGRDALLAVYLVMFVFLLTPMLDGSKVGFLGASMLSPFEALERLTWFENPGPALRTSAVWIGLGLLGVSIASWRLRLSCLRQSDGAHRHGTRRWLKVPPVGNRPMLWKELYTERIGSLGRVGRWIGGAMIAALLAVGLTMAIGMVLGADRMLDLGFNGVYGWLGSIVEKSSFPLMCLIQCAIGLRAAVTIASERERGTWDGLLTSPLEGREIVVGKLFGSLHALRWLIMAAFWAWSIAWFAGFLDYVTALTLFGQTLFVGAFISAMGVRSSLSTATATRAMSITVGFWLLGYGAAFFAAGAVSVIWLLLGLIALGLGSVLGIIDPTVFPRFLMASMGVVFLLSMLGFFLIATLMVVSEARLRFDRIAGRFAGGEVEVAVDQLLHGRPQAPLDELEEVPPPGTLASGTRKLGTSGRV